MSILTVTLTEINALDVEVADAQALLITFPGIVVGGKGEKGDKGDPGDQGPQGLQGIQGPPGSGGDLTYPHDQMVVSAIWTISHNLNKFPSVQVFDSAGDEVEGDIKHLSNTQLTITFSVPFSGKAYCN